MGQPKSTSAGSGRARRRRLRPRRCLRKGCGHIYGPKRWNQRYCQQPECRRELRRWQAAKRQQYRRRSEAVRAQHAAVERERRRTAKLSVKPVQVRSRDSARGHAERARDPARGHAAKDFSCVPCCDRPGCYAARRGSIRNPARYCSDACRLTLARVRDRERKWLCRATLAGQTKRRLEYQNARSRTANAAPSAAGTPATAAMPRAPDPPCGSNPHRSHIIDRDPSTR